MDFLLRGKRMLEKHGYGFTKLAKEVSNSKVHPSDLLLVGGGPRTIIQVNSEILFMILYQHHFEELQNLGAHYDIKTIIVEKQSVIGVGRAFNENQTGMMNSGVESNISFPLPVPFENANLNQLMSFLSYTHRYENLINPNAEAYYEQVRRLNLPGAVMFKNSFGPRSSTENGKLEHDRAYMLRATVGQEEARTSDFIWKLAKSILPFYNLELLPSSKVRRVSISNIERPTVFVESLDNNPKKTIEVSQVRFSSGTTIKKAVHGAQLERLTFCQAMNAEHFVSYCDSRNLLDENGCLRTGVKVISGGTGLSGLDQITVLDRVMNLFEEDDSALGFRVREEARHKYANAITIISRTAGSVCLPRHSFSYEWQQETEVMGTVKHLHSLFLHNYGEEVFRTWMTIVQAAVARARNVTFKTAGGNEESFENILRFQFRESMHFMKCRKTAGHQEQLGNIHSKENALRLSTQTLHGAWRQAALGTVFGIGLHSDSKNSISEMRELAPATWNGREFWLFHRGQPASISNPEFAKKESNLHIFKNFDFLMKHVTSAPVEMHSMLHLLLEAGIMRYEKASYTEIGPSTNTEKMQLHGMDYDLLIVSPIFDRAEDEAEVSIAEHVKHFDEDNPSYGLVGKYRRFVTNTGEYVPVEDYGLGGKGFSLLTADGKSSRAGCFAVDVNNRASAVSIASTLTLRRMALAHLNAAGVPHGHNVLDEIYKSGKPSEAVYNAEVRKFREFYYEAMEIGAYLHAIIQVCEDDALLFRMLYDDGLTTSGRLQVIEKLRKSKVESDRLAADKYYEKLEKIPTFAPPSRDNYLARFVDNTEKEDVFMYNEAMKIARNHLNKTGGDASMKIAMKREFY